MRWPDSRRREYKVLLEEILADDAAARAAGLPSLDVYEIQELKQIALTALDSVLTTDNGHVSVEGAGTQPGETK